MIIFHQGGWNSEGGKKGRLARNHGTQGIIINDEFPRFYFCLIYPRLKTEKSATYKCQ